MAPAAGENAAAAAPWAKRANPSQAGLPASTKAAKAAAKPINPPSSTGRGPIRSASDPKTGLSSTSAPSWRANSTPRVNR